MNYYVIDEHGNKVQSLDLQGIMALLEKAIEDGDLNGITTDSAFVSRVKCCVGGDTVNMAFITQAKYNELVTNKLIKDNTIYFITDDTSADDMDVRLSAIETRLDELGFANIEFKVDDYNAGYVQSNTIIKQGNLAIGNFLIITNRSSTATSLEVVVPEKFRPIKDTSVNALVTKYSTTAGVISVYQTLTLKTDGTLINGGDFDALLISVQIINAGWQLA